MNFKLRLKKSGRLLVIVAVLLLFTAGTLAQAPRFGMMRQGMRQGRGMMGPGITGLYRALKANQEELKITDSQLAKIKDIMFAYEETMVKSKNAANIQALEMKKLMTAEQKDYKKIKAALSRMSDIRHDTLIAGIKAKDDVMNILTPEQQEALKSLAKNRRAGRGFLRRGQRGQRPMRGRMPGSFPMKRQLDEEANQENAL